jgi:glycosyltransferase involved in cell wall biosynthesis
MESVWLNICMYTPSAYSGHARYTHELLSSLSEVGRDKGVEVSLVTSRDLDPKYRTSIYPIYDILPPLLHGSAFRSTLHWGFSRATHYFKRERIFLRWVATNGSCDGIHFQEYTSWLAPRHLRLLKARGKRLFFTVHQINYYPNVPEVLYPVYDSWSRTALHLCDALFVHTESLREQLAKFLGTGHPPIFVTPHGVWNSADSTDTAVSAGDRVQRRRLLFFGANRPEKGLHTLLRAMEGLADCTLTVAGPSDKTRYQEQVRTLVEQLPRGRVELLDRFIEDDEVTRLFEQSSLVVLPYTYFTGQSGVLHDALAYGLPVVATDVGALGESVRRWSIGEVVPANDAAALAGAIREMLTAHRYAEASRAVKRVRRDLSWDHTAEIIIQAYRSIGEGRSKATTP